MKRHVLYNVNLECRMAFCTVCGQTEIHIVPTRTRATSKVLCISRALEIRLDRQENTRRLREQRRSQPDWKPKDILSEIDPEALRALCAICGPTDIRKVPTGRYFRYDCLSRQRAYMHHYHDAHYVAKPSNPHALSNIDEVNQTAICVKCGPVKIEIRHGKKKTTRRCSNANSDP